MNAPATVTIRSRLWLVDFNGEDIEAYSVTNSESSGVFGGPRYLGSCLESLSLRDFSRGRLYRDQLQYDLYD